MIRALFVFDVKYGGSYKAILLTDEHLTYFPLSSVSSGDVLLRDIMMVLFLA